MELPIICFGSPENAVSLIRLNNGYDRSFRVPIKRGEVSADGTGHGTDTSLEEDMGRLLVSQLFDCFVSHSGISLHDPTGDFFVPVPCRILDQNPAMSVLHLLCQPDSVIIVQVCDRSV